MAHSPITGGRGPALVARGDCFRTASWGSPSFVQVVPKPVWTVNFDKGRAIILGQDLIEQWITTLKKCLVMTFLPFAISILEIEDWLSQSWGCLGDLSVSRMDPLCALLSFQVLGEAHQLLSEFPIFENAPFERLQFWSELADVKFVWVHVYGLPLRAWIPEVLQAIGNFLCNVLEIDPFTTFNKNFLYSRFRVAWYPDLSSLKFIPLKVGDTWIYLGVQVENDWPIVKAASTPPEVLLPLPEEVLSLSFLFPSMRGPLVCCRLEERERWEEEEWREREERKWILLLYLLCLQQKRVHAFIDQKYNKKGKTP